MHVSVKQIRSVAHERGDTMVEVLIAIAVVSMILGGAYVTTNRSLQATRAAQERAIALKLAEAQLERLKDIAGDPARSALIFGASPAPPNPFCISTSGTPVATSHIDCHLGPSGTATSSEPIFNISINRTGNNFVLNETWYNVNGKTVDNLQLRYRVYD